MPARAAFPNLVASKYFAVPANMADVLDPTAHWLTGCAVETSGKYQVAEG